MHLPDTDEKGISFHTLKPSTSDARAASTRQSAAKQSTAEPALIYSISESLFVLLYFITGRLRPHYSIIRDHLGLLGVRINLDIVRNVRIFDCVIGFSY